MKSIKSRILFYFGLAAVGLILTILVSVYFSLQRGINTQFGLLIAEMTEYAAQDLTRFHSILNNHLKGLDQEMERIVGDVCNNSDVRLNVEYAQLKVLEPELVQSKTVAAIDNVTGETGRIDFALIFDPQGKLLISYPEKKDFQWLENFCGQWVPLQKALELEEQETGMFLDKIRLGSDFLDAVGLADKSLEQNGEKKGVIALVCSGIVEDSFGDPAAICIVGRLFNQLGGSLARLHKSTGMSSAFFMDEIPMSQAGFIAMQEGNGNEDFDISALIFDSDQKKNIYESNDSAMTLEMNFVGQDYYTKCSVLRSSDGSPLGIAMVALSMAEIKSMKNKMQGYGKEIRKSVLVWIFFIGLAALIGFYLLSQIISASIVRPIRDIVSIVKGMAQGEGDLTVRLSVDREDEVSELARWFNTFMEGLQAMVKEIMQGADLLATSSSQISATASELASSSAESSSSISEISTTMEQVKQTTSISSEKAEQVSQTAEYVAKTSETGMKASQDAVEGIGRIKEEMEYIAESIIKLSEQTQSIGDIISVVNSLSNESNLLSVNASIEAAKAGEYGKGFAVVAQEVKSLADQSKQATARIRTILNDIQSATSTAVMATERGGKAVDAGVDLSVQSGETIKTLAQNVTESSKSAAQIAASSHQQLAGMDQLSQAMMSIKDASLQNVDGARQLEEAIADMSELGSKLKKLAGRFNV